MRSNIQERHLPARIPGTSSSEHPGKLNATYTAVSVRERSRIGADPGVSHGSRILEAEIAGRCAWGLFHQFAVGSPSGVTQ
jgi:hypothetical protein